MTGRNFRLPAQTHAIREFTATLTFPRHLDGSTFSKVIEIVRKLQQEDNLDLPTPMQIQNVILNSDNNTQINVPSIGYQRFNKSGQVDQLLLADTNSLNITQSYYTSWEEVFPPILEAFHSLAAIYISALPAISAFAVRYVNDFICVGGAIKNASEIFAAETPWVAPLARSAVGSWHSHTGRFIPTSENSRLLINVNADVTEGIFGGDPEPGLLARVTIFSSQQFDVPGHKALEIKNGTLHDELVSNFNLAHEWEKRVLSEVVSTPYLKIMGAV